MTPNKDFAILVGKAFLQELDHGHRDSAIAFGRAFLLALGRQGPEPESHAHQAHGKHHADSMATA